MSALAWAGAVVFVGALGYFLFSYWLRFSLPTPGPPDATAIAWNTVLFSVFALHHSVFARTRARAWIARIVPPGLERSFYVWVASLLFIAVCALWRPVGGVAWHVEGPPRWALLLLQILGIWLSVRSAALIDVFDLAGVRMSTAAPRAPVEFKTIGPYGWVRHPIYSGWFLIVLCVGTMTMTQLVFAVVSCTYVLLAIPFEERSLRADSEGAYNRYATLVKWKLVPRIY